MTGTAPTSPAAAPPAGRPRPFGYDHHGQVLKHEAAVLRQVAERILAGSSYLAEARRLTAEGIASPNGHPSWSAAAISRALLAPRVVGDAPAARGAVPAAILDRHVYDALAVAAQARLAARAHRPKTTDGGLLAGIAVCGRCGAPLRRCGPADRRVYRCPGPRVLMPDGTRGCGRLQIDAAGLEAYVTEQTLWAWTSNPPQLAGPPPAAAAIADELARLEAAAATIPAAAAAGLLTDAESRRMQARYAAARTRLRHRRTAAEQAVALPDLAGTSLTAWWPGASPAARRAVVAATFAHFTVHPGRPGRPSRPGGVGIDPERVNFARRPVAVAA